jgi:flagellar P-ring protein precursor FlgI
MARSMPLPRECLVGGVGASSGGSKVTVNHLSAGRIPGGASVERSVPTAVGQGGLSTTNWSSDFGTAQKLWMRSIQTWGRVRHRPWMVDALRSAPGDADARVSFLGRSIIWMYKPVAGMAKVVVNPRTGSVVMNQKVTLERVPSRMAACRSWSMPGSRSWAKGPISRSSRTTAA